MEKLTARERFIIAMKNGQADRVPCAPDISNMIPCRLTGRPFWDIYYYQSPPLWKAYLEAVKILGIDGWFFYGSPGFSVPHPLEATQTAFRWSAERLVVDYRISTPAGDLTEQMTYYIADSPTKTIKPIKDFKSDWKKLRYLMQEPIRSDPELAEIQRKEVGDLGVFGMAVGLPGFQNWFGLAEGTETALTYLYYDEPELLEELRVMEELRCLKMMEMELDMHPDFILIGASGTITLQSPRLARELSLPTLKKLTHLAKQAGVPTMLHSCGLEKDLVKMCAEETELDCINPLEVPPMGDCDLAELKRLYGKRISLMGNLHTTDIMLRGSVAEVEAAARKAIDDAGANGGFILSTGDQCGRDTPLENLRKMVEVCATYGRYD
ncbi:MAG: uroporphyrinogen decarboxylase family protein [Anaerolineae bacterium]